MDEPAELLERRPPEEAFADWGARLRSFYRAMRAAGFGRLAALLFVRDMNRAMVANAAQPGPSPGMERMLEAQAAMLERANREAQEEG